MSESFFYPERSDSPRKGRVTPDGKFIHERIHSPKSLKKRGYTRFRTVTSNKHRIVLAFNERGDSKVSSKLHPISEMNRPHEHIADNLPDRFR